MTDQKTVVRTDALGNNLMIGCNYVYVSSSNGIVQSYIGILTKINPAMVTIQVTRKFLASYAENVSEYSPHQPFNKSVKGNCLVPL